MSDFMPVPSPSPEPSPEALSQAPDDKGLWGHIADVADFLFATKSLGRLLTGEGGWGDLGMVGITAASFFIPPVRLLKFGAKPLESVIAHAAEVVASDTASVTAKRMAEKTAENARYLLENPGKHEELVRLADTADNAEITKLNNLTTQADEFLTSGIVPEPPVRKVGELSSDEIDPSVAKDIAGFKASQTPEVPNRTEPTSAALAERSGETRINKEGQEYIPSKPLPRIYDEQGQLIEDSNNGITRQLYQEGEDIKPLGSLAEHEELLPDYVKYPYLKEDEITNIREKFSPDRLRQEGKSEAQIAEVQRDMEDELRVANIYAKGYATSSKIRSVDEAVIKATKEYDASRIESMKAANAVAESRGQSAPYDIAKETKALQDFRAKQSARKFDEEPRTFDEMTAAEKNTVDEVQAEFPVTADGKPITRRMEDSMPEDLRTGNLKIDRTAWLLSESKKLENFLKKKPSNAGEIRATKDLWNKKANELQLKMDPDERIQANELADQLTERSLADYKASKETVKRGVVNFNIDKETNVAKLTKAREDLLKDYRAETDPDLKKAIAVTGKKVAAKIAALTAGGVVADAVINPANADVRNGLLPMPKPMPGPTPTSSKSDKFLNTISKEDLTNAKKYLKTIKYYDGDPDTYKITNKEIKYLPLLSNEDMVEWMERTNSNLNYLPEKAFQKYVYNESPSNIVNSILEMNGRKLLTPENFGKLTKPLLGDEISHYNHISKKIYMSNVGPMDHEMGHLINDWLLNSGEKDPLKNKQNSNFNVSGWAKYKGKIQPSQIEEIRAQLWEGVLHRLSGKNTNEYKDSIKRNENNLNVNIWDPTTDDPDMRNFGTVRFFDRHGSGEQNDAAPILAYNNPTAWLDYLGVKYPTEWKTKFPPLSENVPPISKLPEGYQEVNTARAVGEGAVTVVKTILKDIFGDWS
jgi:hypothetical protein